MGQIVLKNKTEISIPQFFHFNQNNSGGAFVFDEAKGLTHHVFIQAVDYIDANDRAEKIGIYFGGLGDCHCCGDRWYSQWDNTAGTPTPTLYDEPVETYVTSFAWMPTGKESVVHYLDGRIEWFGVFKK